MRLRKYGNQPDRGVWREVDSKSIKDWRRDLPAGHTRETSAGMRMLPQTEHQGDEAIVERPKPSRTTNPIPAREAIERFIGPVMEELNTLRRTDPEAFRARIRYYQTQGGFTHLTEEEAVEQIGALVRKLAEAGAAQAWASNPGWNRPVIVDATPVEKPTLLLPGQTGKG